MQRALALDKSPALRVSLPLFLAAPVYVLLAALLLLYLGPDSLSSRWTPGALALTHVFTLGVLANAMAGGLLQILPVATGVNVLASGVVGPALLLLLASGTLLLAGGFLGGWPAAFALAATLLAAALGLLATAALGGLWRHRKRAFPKAARVRRGASLALAALAVTVLLGIVLVDARTGGMGREWAGMSGGIVHLTNLHALWGLSGWVGLLLSAMAWQLIPIFQATELYPHPMTRWYGWAVAACLVLASASGMTTAVPLLALLYLAFALATLKLLLNRKRPRPDPTTRFWRLAMLSLAGACLLTLLPGDAPGRPVAIGVLLLAGTGWSAVNGLMYKIVPFLLWFNLQRHLAASVPGVPKVKDFQNETRATGQFRLHAAAITLLTASSLWPWLARPAALTLAASALWLLANLLPALKLYQSGVRVNSDTAGLPNQPR